MGRPVTVDDLSGTHSVIEAQLAAIPEVEAVYSAEDQDQILHVFVVVHEHEPALYDAILSAEERITKRLPNTAIQTHVRASQGRKPSLAVPAATEPLYIR